MGWIPQARHIYQQGLELGKPQCADVSCLCMIANIFDWFDNIYDCFQLEGYKVPLSRSGNAATQNFGLVDTIIGNQGCDSPS